MPADPLSGRYSPYNSTKSTNFVKVFCLISLKYFATIATHFLVPRSVDSSIINENLFFCKLQIVSFLQTSPSFLTTSVDLVLFNFNFFKTSLKQNGQ